MTTENKLRRWLLWGSLIALGVVILGIFVFTRVDIVWNTIINRTDQPVSETAHYYEAIRNQDYEAAYGHQSYTVHLQLEQAGNR